MILVDANLLIYAIDRDSFHHDKAHAWVEQILSETTPVGIAWIVILAFLRITTLKRLTQNALSPERAIAYVDSWLAMPHVSFVVPGEQHWRYFEIYFVPVVQAAISRQTPILPRLQSNTVTQFLRRTMISSGLRA